MARIHHFLNKIEFCKMGARFTEAAPSGPAVPFRCEDEGNEQCQGTSQERII